MWNILTRSTLGMAAYSILLSVGVFVLDAFEHNEDTNPKHLAVLIPNF